MLVTYVDEKTRERLVSHGVREDDLSNVCLPPEPVRNFNPKQGPGYLYYEESNDYEKEDATHMVGWD